MPIPYKAVKVSEPGVIGGGKYKYYARVSKRKMLSFHELCEKISQMSTFSEADMTGALTALTKFAPDLLKQGYSMDLMDLGIISVYIQSEGKDSPEEVSARSIKGAKARYRPSTRIKRELKLATFEKVD